MSHVSTYGMRCKDISKLEEACASLGYQFRLTSGESVRTFGSTTINAVAAIKLPGWRYEVAVDTDGNIKYDHWGSQPDTMKHLGLMVQDYNERVIIEKAYAAESVFCETLADGTKELVLEF